MAELRRLSVFRMRYAAAIGDVDAWAFLTAEICLYHPDCNYDMITFRKVDPLDINAEVAAAALDRVERIDRNARRRGGMYRPTSGVVAGRILNLTAEECWQCDIRTMCPVDPMPAHYAADLRRNADRERKRKARLKADKQAEAERGRKRRATKGAKPRAQYRAEAAAKREQWQAKGVSKATWYRQLRRETGPSNETSPSVRGFPRSRDRQAVRATPGGA
jgi:hypothetical protein